MSSHLKCLAGSAVFGKTSEWDSGATNLLVVVFSQRTGWAKYVLCAIFSAAMTKDRQTFRYRSLETSVCSLHNPHVQRRAGHGAGNMRCFDSLATDRVDIA